MAKLKDLIIRVTERLSQVSGTGVQIYAEDRIGEMIQHKFDVLVTMDRNMSHQQHLSSYSLGIVLITARSNKRQDIEPAMPDVNRAVQEVNPGELEIVAA